MNDVKSIIDNYDLMRQPKIRKPDPDRIKDLKAQKKHLTKYIDRYHGGSMRNFWWWMEFEYSYQTIREWVQGRILIKEHVAEQLEIETNGRLSKKKLRPSLCLDE